MQTNAHAFRSMSDDELLHEVRTLAARERRLAADVIASLAEIDARQLYLPQGCQSLFAYCADRLHFSEHEAYDRMKVARAARQWPLMLNLIAEGSLSVTAARLLAPHLTGANHERVLRAAMHKRVREVEEQVAALRPKPDVPPSVRKLPHARPDTGALLSQPAAIAASPTETHAGSTVPAAESLGAGQVQLVARATDRSRVAPLAPERYRIQFTIGQETRDKLRRAQDLLRHAVPTGDPAVVFDRALTALLIDLEKRKFAAVPRPRTARTTNPQTRHIPSSTRREVWARDGGRCAFVGDTGRWTATGFLEFHHAIPYAAGGLSVASNLELRCRAHNAYEAALYFGMDDLSASALSENGRG